MMHSVALSGFCAGTLRACNKFRTPIIPDFRIYHSELDLERVADATADWKVDDRMDVMCVGSFDGKAKLSRLVDSDLNRLPQLPERRLRSDRTRCLL